MSDFDVLVIGTGPGGEGAAMQAAKHGKRVAVVERGTNIGGACTHRGTIPSKALRYSIFKLTDASAAGLLPGAGGAAKPTFPAFRRSAASIIARQEEMRRSFYTRNRVPVFNAHARFVDPHTLRLDSGELVRAETIVIATGSRPFRPDDIDFDDPRIFDSDTILDLEETPRSITIYGAGVIGCEYASMFRNIDAKVNLINTRSKLLEFLDDEIIDALAYHLRDRGVILRHDESLQGLSTVDDGVIVGLESGKQLKTDIVLWASGRQGNTADLGLETIGLEPNSRGQIAVDEHYRTAVEHVYAVGDVIGFPSLASAAYTQGRLAAAHFVGSDVHDQTVHHIPTGIYTSPEISSVGKTERELTDAKIPYEVGHAQFRSLARAQITGQTVGILKILFHRETLELLGVHCFGAQASEIVHIGQAILSQKGDSNSLLYFMNTTFNYPTMAEAYRVAALNGYNRLF